MFGMLLISTASIDEHEVYEAVRLFVFTSVIDALTTERLFKTTLDSLNLLNAVYTDHAVEERDGMDAFIFQSVVDKLPVEML